MKKYLLKTAFVVAMFFTSSILAETSMGDMNMMSDKFNMHAQDAENMVMKMEKEDSPDKKQGHMEKHMANMMEMMGMMGKMNKMMMQDSKQNTSMADCVGSQGKKGMMMGNKGMMDKSANQGQGGMMMGGMMQMMGGMMDRGQMMEQRMDMMQDMMEQMLKHMEQLEQG